MGRGPRHRSGFGQPGTYGSIVGTATIAGILFFVAVDQPRLRNRDETLHLEVRPMSPFQRNLLILIAFGFVSGGLSIAIRRFLPNVEKVNQAP